MYPSGSFGKMQHAERVSAFVARFPHCRTTAKEILQRSDQAPANLQNGPGASSPATRRYVLHPFLQQQSHLVGGELEPFTVWDAFGRRRCGDDAAGAGSGGLASSDFLF